MGMVSSLTRLYIIDLIFFRPTDSLGGPMATNVLSDNCRALGIPHPGCLCPLQDVNEPPFVEASINLVTLAGSHYGEYVAECSTGSCGYLGPSFID